MLRDWKGGITEEQKWELYIPSGVKAENELFNGFGRRELLQSIAGSLFGGAVAAVIWLCSNNVAFTVVAALTGIFGRRDDVYQRPEQSERSRSRWAI